MVASLSRVTCEKIIAEGNIHGMVPLMTPPSDIISIKVFFFLFSMGINTRSFPMSFFLGRFGKTMLVCFL